MAVDLNDPAVRLAIRTKARHQLWREGDLSYLWDPTQKKIDALLKKTNSRQFYLNCSRRLGKTYYLITKAFEVCLQKPNARVLFCAPQAKDASSIVNDILVSILPDCPDDVKPEFKSQANDFRFNNGSILRLRGVNGDSARDLRGTGAQIIIADECGFYDNFEDTLSSIFMPMVMSAPDKKGYVILASTPAKSPGHDSFKVYSRLALEGATADFTIRDADSERYPDSLKAEFLKYAGEAPEDCLDIIQGRKEPQTSTAQREYFVQWVSDSESRLIPNWTPAAAKEIVQRLRAPNGKSTYNGVFDCYTVLDPGIKDGTGILYAWYDFLQAKICIVGEDLLRGANTAKTAATVLAREYELYNGSQPYMRYSDIDARLMIDFRQLHGISIAPVNKPRIEEGINLIQVAVQNRDLIIDPSCEKLIRQLEHGIYNKAGTDLGRDADGHNDVLSALRYLLRMVNRRKMPAGYIPSSKPVNQDHYRPRALDERNQASKMGLLPATSWGKKLAGSTCKTCVRPRSMCRCRRA